MLTAVQRAEILGLTAESGLDSSTVTDEDIWYDFRVLFQRRQDVEGSELSRSEQPEIMACLRRAASSSPRTFSKGGQGLV